MRRAARGRAIGAGRTGKSRLHMLCKKPQPGAGRDSNPAISAVDDLARRLLSIPVRGGLAMHPFDKLTQAANPWVESMMAELRITDPYKAVRALGAGLAALRELMTAQEMSRFVGRLPVVVRGLFFEGWDPQVRRREIHHRSQLLALLGQKYAPHADLPTDVLLTAFLAVLDQRLRPEEMAEIARKLHPLTGDFSWAAIAAGAARPQVGGPQ